MNYLERLKTAIETTGFKDETRQAEIQGEYCLLIECFTEADERTGDCESALFVVVQKQNCVPEVLGEPCNWKDEIEQLAWQQFQKEMKQRDEVTT